MSRSALAIFAALLLGTGIAAAQTIIGGGGASGVPSIAGTANQINQSGSPGATTLSLSSTLALPGTLSSATNGAASTPAVKLTGTIFSGTSTTAQPLLLLQPSNATGCTSIYQTTGTAFGICAHTGIARLLDFFIDGTEEAYLDAGGTLFVNNLLFANGALTVGAGSNMSFSGRTLWTSPADGNIWISNQAQTDFGRMMFGGTTSSFPALKRSTTGLVSRLADDSADSWLLASYLKTDVTTVAGLPSAATAGQGAHAFVSDASACATLNGALTGGGATKCPVHSDGTSWLQG